MPKPTRQQTRQARRKRDEAFSGVAPQDIEIVATEAEPEDALGLTERLSRDHLTVSRIERDEIPNNLELPSDLDVYFLIDTGQRAAVVGAKRIRPGRYKSCWDRETGSGAIIESASNLEDPIRSAIGKCLDRSAPWRSGPIDVGDRAP